jgi:hypothetical protein
MSTALDIVKSARRLLNIDAVGESIPDSDADESLYVLNMIISSWNNQRLMLYEVKNITGTLTANKNPHTIGPAGADITADRPLRIERAFTRITGTSTPVDFSMEQVTNNRYQEFVVKNISTSYPTHFYYAPANPTASIYLYPVPSQALQLHLSVWMKLSALSTLNTTLAMPEGYENALRYALAVDIGPMYGKPQTRGGAIYERASQLLRDIKAVNQEDSYSTIDMALTSDGRRGFQLLRGF